MDSVIAKTKGTGVPSALTDEDRLLLATMAQALATLKREPGRPWEEVAQKLERGGWHVGWHLAWIAEAKREGSHEQAAGRTLDGAFAQLWDLTLLDAVEGCP